MSIENIGLGHTSSSEEMPRIPAHRVIQRHESVREDSYVKAKWSQENENERLRVESYRAANVNKINKNGVRETDASGYFYKSNTPAYMRNVGTSFDVLA